MVPDKVAYTSGEKKAEILGGIMLAVFAAVIIALMALGVSGGGNTTKMMTSTENTDRTTLTTWDSVTLPENKSMNNSIRGPRNIKSPY